MKGSSLKLCRGDPLTSPLCFTELLCPFSCSWSFEFTNIFVRLCVHRFNMLFATSERSTDVVRTSYRFFPFFECKSVYPMLVEKS
ncbi:hypothetical protein ACHQM5_025515 [Ranunculus cassubicifolius]